MIGARPRRFTARAMDRKAIISRMRAIQSLARFMPAIPAAARAWRNVCIV